MESFLLGVGEHLDEEEKDHHQGDQLPWQQLLGDTSTHSRINNHMQKSAHSTRLLTTKNKLKLIYIVLGTKTTKYDNKNLTHHQGTWSLLTYLLNNKIISSS